MRQIKHDPYFSKVHTFIICRQDSTQLLELWHTENVMGHNRENTLILKKKGKFKKFPLEFRK